MEAARYNPSPAEKASLLADVCYQLERTVSDCTTYDSLSWSSRYAVTTDLFIACLCLLIHVDACVAADQLCKPKPACPLQVHGWLMCLAWGCLIPIGVVIAAFRSLAGYSSWWFYLHVSLQSLGFLVSLAGVTVGSYLNRNEKLQWQHRNIGITVTTLAGLQVKRVGNAS